MDIWIYEYIYNSGVSCISGESSVSATPMYKVVIFYIGIFNGGGERFPLHCGPACSTSTPN